MSKPSSAFALRDRRIGRRPRSEPLARYAAALLLAATWLPLSAHAGDMVLTIANIEKAEGQIRLAVYASEADFRKSAIRSVQHAVAGPGDVRLEISDLPAGDYAVLAYQDLNGNEELDTNLMGIPKEPWGASLDGKKVFGAPGWADVRFAVPADGIAKTITLK